MTTRTARICWGCTYFACMFTLICTGLAIASQEPVTVSATPTEGGAYEVSLSLIDWIVIGSGAITNLVAFVVLFTRLAAKVDHQGERVSETREEVSDIRKRVIETSTQLARIEGKLESKT